MKNIVIRKRKGKTFDPSRDYINNAVKEYLKYGGEIEIIRITSDTPFSDSPTVKDVDEFLLGM